ncbi:hypothetical protein BGZ74_004910, partial [Mortierella antarctica]
MEPLDITTSTTKSKGSRASSHSGSVDTAMTTPVKDSSQEKSQDRNDPLGLFDIAMDDSDDEPLLPSTLTRSLNTRATSQPSPSKPAYTSARRNSPGPLSPHLRPAPGASTSSLFGSSGSTIRVTKSPKKPKKSNSVGGGGGGSLFSPTLSPRKLKKSASAGFILDLSSGDGSAGNGSEFTDKEVGADLVQAQVPRRISEKDRVKLRMEAERLKRSVPVSVPEIVNEKKTMSWLLQETQNK